MELDRLRCFVFMHHFQDIKYGSTAVRNSLLQQQARFKYDLLLHAGDMAYADGNQVRSLVLRSLFLLGLMPHQRPEMREPMMVADNLG